MSRIYSEKLLLSTAAVLSLAIGGGAMFRLPAREARDAAIAAVQATPAPVAVVECRDIVPWMEFSGRLEAIDHVNIRSRVSGQVLAIHFREGGLVKKGDLLVTLDPAPFEAELSGAQARVAQAQARLTLTSRDYERSRKLAAAGYTTKRDLDTRTNAYIEAQASLKSAEAALDMAQLNLSYTQVRAPISGRIGKAEITPGNLVAAGPAAPILASLVSVSPIYATFDADERAITNSLADLKPDADGARPVERIPVLMSGPEVGAEPISGRVAMIDNAVNVRSGTVQVRAVFDNSTGNLIPGQFARLRMGRAKPVSALLISEKAVGTDQDKKFVLFVGDDNVIAYREIVLGAVVDGMRIVTGGLKAGERIIGGGLQRLQPGMLITPQKAAMNPPSGTEVAHR
jgi:multidrug efflux system membrane fusion protein